MKNLRNTNDNVTARSLDLGVTASILTLGEDILRYTTIGASEVLANCEGWLMVSQSKTTSCSVRANSNILSISAWTSAAESYDRQRSDMEEQEAT